MLNRCHACGADAFRVTWNHFWRQANEQNKGEEQLNKWDKRDCASKVHKSLKIEVREVGKTDMATMVSMTAMATKKNTWKTRGNNSTERHCWLWKGFQASWHVESCLEFTLLCQSSFSKLRSPVKTINGELMSRILDQHAADNIMRRRRRRRRRTQEAFSKPTMTNASWSKCMFSQELSNKTFMASWSGLSLGKLLSCVGQILRCTASHQSQDGWSSCGHSNWDRNLPKKTRFEWLDSNERNLAHRKALKKQNNVDIVFLFLRCIVSS